MTDHEILLGLHWHEENAAGIEVACECGDVLLIEEGPDAILTLSEVKIIAERHRELCGLGDSTQGSPGA